MIHDLPTPPILLEPGLRFVGVGTNDHGQWVIKFINTGQGRIREVAVHIVATNITYHYAVRDPATSTIVGYEGKYGDPNKDTSFVWGSLPPY